MGPVLAIVIPIYNEERSLPSTLTTLKSLLLELMEDQRIASSSFLLFVDDGSHDESWSIVRSACQASSLFKGIRLSRNFGHNSAVLAGLMRVRGCCEVAISIDCDLQQDPRAIPLFLDEYEKGSEIVFGVRRDRATDGSFKRITATLFYRMMRMLGVNLLQNHADFRLMGSKALDALAKYQEPNLFLRGVTYNLGFCVSEVYFDVRERRFGKSQYTPMRMLKLAVDGLTSFSHAPLRLVLVIGVIVFGLTLAMSLFVVISSAVVGNTVPGWASILLPIYLLGGLQILCLGILGEYLAQVYTCVKGRPRFLVDEEVFGDYLPGPDHQVLATNRRNDEPS